MSIYIFISTNSFQFPFDHQITMKTTTDAKYARSAPMVKMLTPYIIIML